MGYQKFALKPNPDFVVQVIHDRKEEQITMDAIISGNLNSMTQ